MNSQYERANYRRAVVNRYKRIKGCARCGYRKHSFALEFNHLDPLTKHRTIASLMYYSWKRIKLEISKCEILCANCHQIETLLKKSPTKRRERHTRVV